MSEASGTKFVESKPLVSLSGTVKDVKNKPSLGVVEIGESPRAYIFQVSLPGVCKPQCNLKVDVHVDGKVEIEGLVQESEFVNNHTSNLYNPKLQQLAPLGNFNISFNLPGRVDPRLVSPTFKKTGILEVVVMKHTIPTINQPNNSGTPVSAPM
ncbi:increased DNA methylation 3-like [Rutidosis leptorrhynchoides]|uniref:increased DNA methylation 3-like n=1 Tax=Rutidosis leptorrhynchoides TaxID=125765 RepID=UPI003A9909B8